MMRRIFLFLFISSFSIILFSQDRPVFFPEDIDDNTLHLKCLCNPGVTNKSRSRGVELSFVHTNRSELEQEEGYPLSQPFSELTLQNLIFKLRLPLINKEGLKVILGVFYRPEHYDFNKIGADYQPVFQHIDGRNLHSSGFEALATKSWNEKIYTSVRVRNLYNGDYNGIINFDNRYSIFNVSALIGIKKDDYKEIGFGLNLSHSFRNTIVLPFFLYNHTFNDKWGIEMVLPALATVRYNLTEKSLLLFGIRYNSRSYSIGDQDDLNEIYNLNHSEIRTEFSLEQNIHPWVWLDFAAGFQYNFSTDFEGVGGAETFQVEPGSTPTFRFGIFVSPPSSFLK